jgi:hypothetical protein
MAIRIDVAGSYNDKDIKRAMRDLQSLGAAAGGASKTFGQQFMAMSESMEKVGKEMTTKVTLPILAAGALAFKAFSEEQDAIARVTGALKANGGQANVTAEQITTMASSLQKTTTFADDATISAAGLLLTFHQVRNEFGEGNQVFDRTLVAAQNLSAALGTDLESSTMQLAKAMENPVRGMTALSRSGTTFTEQQRAMVKSLVDSGDQLGAQKVILDVVESQYGGMAETMAGTASGKIKQAFNAISDSMEKFGAIIAPVLVTVANAFAAFAGFVGGLPGPMQALIVVVAGFAAALGPVIWATGSVLTNTKKIMAVNWAGMFNTGAEVAKGFASAVSGGMTQALAAVRAMSTGSMLAFGAIGLAIVAAGAALMYFVKNQAEEARQKFKALDASAVQLERAFSRLVSTNELTGPLNDVSLALSAIKTEADGSTNAFVEMLGSGKNLTAVQEVFTRVDNNADAARDTLNKFDESMSSIADTDISKAVAQFNALKLAVPEVDLNMFPQLKVAIEAAAETAGVSVPEFLRMSDAGGRIKTEFDLATEALDDWEAEVRSQFDPLFAYGDSLDTLRDAQRQQGEAALVALAAVQQHGAGSTEAQVAVGAYQASIRGTTSASFDAAFQLERLREGLQTGAISFGTASAAADGLVAAGILNEEQARLTKEEWARLSGIVVNTPNSKVIEVSAPGLSAVSEALGNIQTKLGNITSFGGRIKIDVGGNAAGGPVQAGKMGWVGERGRELFIPSTDGVIVPHYESRRMMSNAGTAGPAGGGGSTYNITINGMVGKDKRDILDFLARELPKAAATHSRSYG